MISSCHRQLLLSLGERSLFTALATGWMCCRML